MESESKQYWQKKIQVPRPAEIPGSSIIKVGRIATGEKVVSDIKTELYKKIRTSCGESLAVECEGGGFYFSCNEAKAKGLLIRGISDKLTDKSTIEQFNSQPYASAAAAAFLFELIERL
jgi:nucleoside phosphorylase